MLVAMDNVGRARGGYLDVETSAISWQPEPPDPALAAGSERLNMQADKLIDFGAAVTNGAFRLLSWRDELAIDSATQFARLQVELRLDQLGANGQKVKAITAMDVDGNLEDPVKFQQDGANVSFDTAGKIFAYRISLVR